LKRQGLRTYRRGACRIVTVSPGNGGLGTFSPLLDKAGNSVKGQLVAKLLSQRLGMDLFVSKPRFQKRGSTSWQPL
jgi:hypothetical protein